MNTTDNSLVDNYAGMDIGRNVFRIQSFVQSTQSGVMGVDDGSVALTNNAERILFDGHFLFVRYTIDSSLNVHFIVVVMLMVVV